MKRHLRTTLFLLACSAILIAAALEINRTEERSKGSWEESFIIPHVYYEMTTDVDHGSGKPRVSLCCHVNSFLIGDECVKGLTNGTKIIQLPLIHNETNLAPANLNTSDEYFNFVVWNPCAGRNRYALNPQVYEDEKWYLIPNGSILRPLAEEPEERILDYHQYCLARVRSHEYQEYLAFFCEETYPDDDGGEIVYSFGMLVSVPFLAATYVIYWILPDLKNLHGLTLRGYVGCLATAYSIVGILQLTPQEHILTDICIALGIHQYDVTLVLSF